MPLQDGATEGEAMMRDIRALNKEMIAAGGTWK